MINVDIHTKLVAASTRIYVVRPGANYRLYAPFIDEGFVGPELPSLDLPEFKDFDEVEDIRDRIMRAAAIRRWFAAGAHPGENPERDLTHYQMLPTSRAVTAFMSITRGFFKTLEQGDLVVVPPINFKGTAYIGELVEEASTTRTLLVPRYPGEPLTGRRVRWLATMQKSELPAKVLDALQKPLTIFLLQRDFWPQILRRAYGSYTTEGEYGARFEVTEDRFQTVDDFAIQAFFNFVVANSQAIANGMEVQDLKRAAFADIRAIAPDLFTNVNSPGGISLRSATIVPIVIATMLSLALYVGPGAVDAAVNDTIRFGNSLAPADDPCAADVRKEVVTQLTLLGFDRWAEACEIVREAAERTGVNSGVKVVP